MATILSSFAASFTRAFAEHLCVRRRVRNALLLFTGGDVEFDDAVIFVLRGFGWRVAFAFLGADVHKERAIVRAADIFQNRQQLAEIVAIDDADVIEAEFFEQCAAGDKAARKFFREVCLLLEKFRQVVGDLLADVAKRHVRRTRQQTREIIRHGANGRCNRHLVVIQDNDQAPVHGAGVVHRLIGHPRGNRAIADHADHVMLLAGKVACHSHAQTCRYRCRGVGGAEAVVFAFGTLGKT